MNSMPHVILSCCRIMGRLGVENCKEREAVGNRERERERDRQRDRRRERRERERKRERERDNKAHAINIMILLKRIYYTTRCECN